MTNVRRVTTGMMAFAALLGAETANATEAWASHRHVTYLYPAGDGFTFGLDGDQIGANPCGNRFFLPLSQAGDAYDAIVSTIMTAFTAGYFVDAAYDTEIPDGCNFIINLVVVTKS